MTCARPWGGAISIEERPMWKSKVEKVLSWCVFVGAAAAASGTAMAADASDSINLAAERALASEARLPTILRVVGARNPDLQASVERTRAAEAGIVAAVRLPDPELKGELWGVPIAHAVAFDQANTIMLGLRQSFPAWGSRDARARAAREDAAAVDDSAEVRRQEIVAQTRRAFATYARTDREYRIRLEHVGLASRLVEIAQSLYQVGHGAQQDLLHAQAELSRLHVDIVGVEQQRRSAQALLNALMDRAPDAPLGPVAEIAYLDVLGASADISPDASARLDVRRPELTAAERAVKRSDAMLEAVKREAELPSLMVGADYWYMPTAPSHNAYGAMVSMSLPWLNPGRRDEVMAATHARAAEQCALRAQIATARYQLGDAAGKVRAARETLALINARVLPDARRSFESAQANFQNGQGDVVPVLDAQRNYLQVRIDEVRAVADLETSRADYARAAGLSVAAVIDGAPEVRR
jgi:cobalt-zinc-cadmium efflux system outer membrane protein